jgi:hypothetical protein
MTMRITTPTSLAILTRTTHEEDRSGRGTALLRRINAYTRWAFNPQRELTSRYDRAA